MRFIWYCSGEISTNLRLLRPKLKFKQKKMGNPNDPCILVDVDLIVHGEAHEKLEV